MPFPCSAWLTLSAQHLVSTLKCLAVVTVFFERIREEHRNEWIEKRMSKRKRVRRWRRKKEGRKEG